MKLPSLAQMGPRKRLLAAVAGVIVLCVAMDRAVLNPWLRHTATMRKEIREMETQLRSFSRLLARKQAVFVELEPMQRYIQPPMTDELKTASLVQEVEQVASESGVRMGEIKPLRTEPEANATRYVLDVRFDCDTSQWVEFVYRLEASPSLFAIQQAGLSVAPEAPDRLQGFLRVSSTAIKMLGPAAPSAAATARPGPG